MFTAQTPLTVFKNTDVKQLAPDQLSRYQLALLRKRQKVDEMLKELKSLESKARLIAEGSEFMAGVETSSLTYGSYKRSDQEFITLPEEGGWSAVNRYIADRIIAGEDPDEVLFTLSHQRLNPKAFENVNDADLPVGMKRETKRQAKFSPKRNAQLT